MSIMTKTPFARAIRCPGVLRKASCLAGAGFMLMSVTTPASAAETVTYSYDALGRLTGASVSGGPNTGITTTTQFDAADNRSNYQLSGSPFNSPAPSGIIVIPLAGFTIIPIF